MTVQKLTTILIVEAIEPCLPLWKSLGYRVTAQVPDNSSPLGFVILQADHGELMLQTRASLAEDLPAVAERRPSYLLYADVASLAVAKRAVQAAKEIVAERRTFYGALESWLELPGGVVLGLAEHSG